MAINGIDVSEYQGNINWAAVAKSGVEFVMVRATIGPDRVDKNFSQNANEALSNGIYVGSYHYCHAKTIEAAVEEANHFLNTIKGHTMNYPVVLDIEDKALETIPKKTLTDISIAFLNTLIEANYYPMIYSNVYWFTYILDDERLKNYDHWVAQYGTNNEYPGVTDMWQYSETGRVDGIVGDVDLNYSYRDYNNIIRRNNLNHLNNGRSFFILNEFEEEKKYSAGDMITLQDANVYAYYNDSKAYRKVSGNFFLYDGIAFVNELGETRYRITQNRNHVGNGIRFVVGSVRDSDFIKRIKKL